MKDPGLARKPEDDGGWRGRSWCSIAVHCGVGSREVIIESEQFPCALKQMPAALVQLDAAALAPDDHDLAKDRFEPLHLPLAETLKTRQNTLETMWLRHP